MDLDRFLRDSGFSGRTAADILKMLQEEAGKEKVPAKAMAQVGMHGHLAIYREYDDGRRELAVDTDNMVVQGGFIGMSNLFGASANLTYAGNANIPGIIAAGNGNPAGTPSTPLITQTLLDNEVYRNVIGYSGATARTFISNVIGTPPTSTQNAVRFEMRMPKTNTVGENVVPNSAPQNALCESALFANNGSASSANTGTMLCRVSHALVTKDATFDLLYQWTISFTP